MSNYIFLIHHVSYFYLSNFTTTTKTVVLVAMMSVAITLSVNLYEFLFVFAQFPCDKFDLRNSEGKYTYYQINANLLKSITH